MKWARIYLFYSKFPQFLLSNGYYFHADKLENALELNFCGQPDEPVLEDKDDDDEDDDDDEVEGNQ